MARHLDDGPATSRAALLSYLYNTEVTLMEDTNDVVKECEGTEVAFVPRQLCMKMFSELCEMTLLEICQWEGAFCPHIKVVADVPHASRIVL